LDSETCAYCYVFYGTKTKANETWNGFPACAYCVVNCVPALSMIASDTLFDGAYERMQEVIASAKKSGESSANQRDMINKPPHYTSAAIEVIDIIEAFKLNFHLGNVVKYVLREGKKGDPLEDLKKARWYLDREITRREHAASTNKDGVK
jgi:hypothetical protein